jgi:Ca-activated chloride channel family protein
MKSKRFLFLVFTSSICLLMAFTDRKAASLAVNNSVDTFPFLHKLSSFNGKTITSSQGSITLNSGLHNDFYFVDSANRIGYYYTETRVGNFINQSAKRLPLNIAVVIDRSGSMAGAKMKYAKEAAKAIIDKLTAEDYVSVVMYDHEVTLIQPSIHPISKDSIKRKIDAIDERGSTNLWGGSEKGYEQVKTSFHPSYVNRVLLISDGLANSGLTNARVIQNKVRQYKDADGITLSTFGVGLDYNEVLMTDMAENGSGNYYFINDLDKMAAILENEIHGMARIAAKDAVLKIKVPQGITVNKVYAFKAESKPGEILLRFRDLFSNEVKGVLLQFQLPTVVSQPLVFTSQLSFKDAANGSQKELSNDAFLSPTQLQEEYLTHFNRSVLEQAVLFQSNEALEKAMLEADNGLFEGARRSLLKNEQYLKQHEKLVKSSIELQKMEVANRAYYQQLLNAETLGQDSIKLMQKSNRAASYKIRAKKS